MQVSRQTNCRLLVTFSDGSTVSKKMTVKELSNYYNIDLSLFNKLTYDSFKSTLQGKFSHYAQFELELL